MNFFKKSVIEIVGYIFFSFVIVIIAAFFFASSCSAFYDDFDSYSDGYNLNIQYPYYTSINVLVSDDQYLSESLSAKFPSTGTGYLNFNYATSTINALDFSIYRLDNRISLEFILSNRVATSSEIGIYFMNLDSDPTSIDNDLIIAYTPYAGFGTSTKIYNIANEEDEWIDIKLIKYPNGWKVYYNEIYLGTYQFYDEYNAYFLQMSAANLFIDNLTVGFGDPTYEDNTTSYENYDFQLSEVEPDFGTVVNQICFLGVECRLYFSFNSLAVGYPMYLFNYEDSNFPGNEIASTIVTAAPLWQNYVIVPDQATSTELKYNFLLDAGEYGWIVKTGIQINWWSEAEWQAYLDDIGPDLDEYCSAENVCENVATSSDFLYGVQCGFQQGICWMLVPNSSSKNFFFNTVTKFESSFPFNFYFTIVNQAKSNFQKSASSDASLDFPMYSTSTGEVSWQPLISSSTVTDVWNDDTYDLTNNIFTWAWWLLVIFAITYLVYRQMI